MSASLSRHIRKTSKTKSVCFLFCFFLNIFCEKLGAICLLSSIDLPQSFHLSHSISPWVLISITKEDTIKTSCHIEGNARVNEMFYDLCARGLTEETPWNVSPERWIMVGFYRLCLPVMLKRNPSLILKMTRVKSTVIRLCSTYVQITSVIDCSLSLSSSVTAPMSVKLFIL